MYRSIFIITAKNDFFTTNQVIYITINIFLTKMIELCERRDEICENCSLEDEIGDISFEELLEIEKKDSAFW